MWKPAEDYFFHVRTKILAGYDKARFVKDEVKEFNATKIILVTDQGLIKSGTCELYINFLKEEGIKVEIFNEVHSDPTVTIMDKIANIIKNNEIEVIVGLGGGSVLDAAKGAAIVATNGGSIRDYVGENKFSRKPLPVIAIPTTAGTGSEVTWHISVHDEEAHKKVTVRSALCVPEVAILDPKLLTTLPQHVAASTGMDAFTHSFESYISTKGAWLFTEALGLESMRLIGKNLRTFVANRKDLEAGGNMLVASMLGGMCLSHARTGIVHQMARPLGAHYGISHGLANSIMLPYAMEFCYSANIDKFKKVAEVLGANIQGLTDVEAARKAVDIVRQLSLDIGLPQKLRELGVKEEKLNKLAEDAMQGKASFTNPREGNKDDLLMIYKKAF